MTIPLECDGAASDAVLQAARAALSSTPGQWTDAGVRNRPMMPLLVALLEATAKVAAAVADNAFEDCVPMPRDLANDLNRDAQRIAGDILNAAGAPSCQGWSLPSMSGKELV